VPDLLAGHPDADELAIDLSGCGRVDWSAAMAVREALEDAGQAGMHGFLTGLPTHTERWRANVWRDVEVR